MATRELTFKVNVDPAVATQAMNNFTRTVVADTQQITNISKQQAAAVISLQKQRSAALIAEFKREEREAARSEATKLREAQRAIAEAVRAEQRRSADVLRSANQRIKEEQRAAREVIRINAETARQAAQQERLRERAAKQLADVQIKEAKRAAKELEKSLQQSRSGGSGGGALLGSITSRIPGLGGITSELSGLSSTSEVAGGSLAALAGPVGIATAALLAGAAAGVAMAKSLFDLTKQTAEFQGKFQDLSQQVGVSVETLSTLDVIASTTGGNIESVTASLGIFQKHLESAHDPTSKEAKLLKELGVTSLNTETALRQTISGLFKLGETQKQTDAALTLFGKSGRFVNAILKESKGDLDAATKKFQEMGLVVSGPAAAAADRFNDSLGILNRQIQAVGIQLTQQAIPAFVVFFEELNEGLAGNREQWDVWGEVIESQVFGVIATMKALAQFTATQGAIDFGTLFQANLRGLIDDAGRVRAQILTQAGIDTARRLLEASGRPGDRPDADKARKEAAARAAKNIALQQQAIEQQFRIHQQNLEAARDKDIKNIDEWEKETKDLAARHLADQQKIFDKERENARKFIKNREDLSLALREIDLKDEKAQDDFLNTVTKARDDAQKRRDQRQLKLEQDLLTIRDAQRDGELQKIKADIAQRVQAESAGIQREIALLRQAFDDRKVLRDLELQQTTTAAQRKSDLNGEQLADEVRFTNEFKRLSEQRIDALAREAAAAAPAPGGGRKVQESPNVFLDERGRILDPSKIIFDEKVLGPPPELSLWETALAHLKDIMGNFHEFVRGTFLNTFTDIADALAQGVIAWALYGESFGEAMKKSLAAVAAKIAAEATFQAALHAAYAIASLAFGDFRGAAQHGIAAAKFAGVAAVAAVAARGLVGGGNTGSTFTQPASGSGGSGVGQLSPLQLERNSGRNQVLKIVLEQQVKSNDSHIVKTVVKNIQVGGDIREVIQNDGALV